MKVDYHLYRSPLVVFSSLSAVIGLLVLAYFWTSAAHTHRWIHVPGFSLQPSEIGKIALIIFLAYLLERRKDAVNNLWTLLPVLTVVGVVSGLIVMEPDLGTAVMLLLVSACLLFAAGLDPKWFGLAALLSFPAFYLFVLRVPYRRDRIFGFLHPEDDPQGKGFHILQSLIAVGAGGVSGLGYMEGKQKLFYLPEAHTDFIFAVIGEELGLIGTLAILGLFGVFLWRGLLAAYGARDLFGFYLALGITLTVCLQAFLNMSVVLGMVPTKGIPLPFLSYGGSSAIVMLGAVGILLNVSQQSRAEVT
jgi:cell division protein FtsW